MVIIIKIKIEMDAINNDNVPGGLLSNLWSEEWLEKYLLCTTVVVVVLFLGFFELPDQNM